MAYEKAGSYHSGLWLVVKDNKAAIVDRHHLPAEGHGFQYYWLGHPGKEDVVGRLFDALPKLNLSDPSGWLTPDLHTLTAAQQSGYLPLQHREGGGGGLRLGELLAWGVAGITAGVPLGATAGKVAGQAGAAEAGAAGAAGAGVGAASKAGSTLLKGAEALSVAALFANIGLWKGVGLVIAGAALILIGILNLAGVDPGGIGHTAKRVIG